MKDPDSFEKINADTGYLSDYKGDTTDAPYLYANIRYRAKNSFGGYVIEKRSVVMKSDFSPLEIFESKWQKNDNPILSSGFPNPEMTAQKQQNDNF